MTKKKKGKPKHKGPSPMPFQGIGIWRMARVFGGRALNADEIGLGKSMQGLHSAVPYRHGRHILIVCPNAVKWGWEAEVKKHLGLQSWVLEGIKPPKRLPLYIPPVIILNWDILSAWLPTLLKLKINVVIGDEIHYIKNRSAKRTKSFIKLCKEIEFIYALSGTPMENSPVDLFPILNILRPDLFPSFTAFAMRYCKPVYTPWGIKYTGATRVKELRAILRKNLLIRRLRKDVLKDLPPLQRVIVPVKMEGNEYREAERNFVAWMFKKSPGKAIKMVKSAIHLQKLNQLLGLVAEKKVKAVFEWIDNFLASSNEKLTVFAHHRDFLAKLHERYKDQSVMVRGGMPSKKRQQAIESFHDDKRIRIFFGSITATGTGINKLQEVCSKMAIVELIWVGLKLLQVEGRLWRIGQTNPVTVFYLIDKTTVEAKICKAIHQKQSNFNAIMDGNFEQQEFDILEGIFKDIKKGKK